MIEAYKKMWVNGFNFKDKTTRRDFWLAFLMNVIVSFVIGFVCGFISGLIPALKGIFSFIPTLYSLAVLIPSLAMEIRRMHDVNKSGWYLLISLIPLVGWILLLVAYCTDSVPNDKYGVQL